MKLNKKSQVSVGKTSKQAGAELVQAPNQISNGGKHVMLLGPHQMKILLVFGNLWNLGLSGFPKTPPHFELFPTETWDFFDFLTTPPPPLSAPGPKFQRFLVWKASLITHT